MKKIVFFCLLIYNINVFAQISDIHFAVEPNLSWLSNNIETVENGANLGLNLRSQITYKFNSFFSIASRPGISYYKTDLVFYSNDREDSRSVNEFLFVSIPFYTKFTTQDAFSIYLGVETEYLIFSETKNSKSDETFMDHLNNNFLFSMSIGFSYKFKNNLIFSSFYNHGLNSILNNTKQIDNTGNPIGDIKIIKNNFSIGLGIPISKGNR